jgi:pyruvate dehydrogenase E1 component beta subunit
LQAAIRDPDPVIFLENELVYGTNFDISDDVLDENFVLPIGKAKVQKEGKDITLVAHSIGVKFCMDAAEILAKDGISCEVINLRSIRPLDIDTVNESVKKTHHLITVEGKMLELWFFFAIFISYVQVHTTIVGKGIFKFKILKY